MFGFKKNAVINKDWKSQEKRPKGLGNRDRTYFFPRKKLCKHHPKKGFKKTPPPPGSQKNGGGNPRRRGEKNLHISGDKNGEVTKQKIEIKEVKTQGKSEHEKPGTFQIRGRKKGPPKQTKNAGGAKKKVSQKNGKRMQGC